MTAAYRFGRFEFKPASRQLLVEGQPAALGARAFDVLLTLIERRERLVTKDELLDLAWPGLVVEENNLQVQISGLRKILGDRIITTVPGRGYQFTAEITRSDPSGRGLVDARSCNLPQPLTRFIGHEADLDEYEKIVATSRLVTLTGVGGCGKTRLAIELALRVLPSFAHGVWFVDLAPMADAERLPLTVARTLELTERPGHPIVETLYEHLAGQQILLVLDNCEHLVSACAALVQTMLGRASQLKVLATSREALGVPGEHTLRVRSLSCPPPEQSDAFDQLLAFEAVELFVDRARLIHARFALDATSAPAIAEICRRLDGIPLALELAAARVRALSVENIAARLSDRFRLLTGGDKTALPRQQTLLTSIDWSHELLSEPERVLLRRLSVFAGGWTLEAAEAVGAGGELEQSHVLDLLTQLVEKSLVELEADGQRYRLLETVRQYAQSRLNESGEEQQLRARHVAFFVALAEQAAPGLYGPTQVEWLDRLDLERENLLSAHEWCDRVEGGVEFGLRLVSSVLRYWLDRGPLDLGYRVTTEALGRVGAREYSVAWCQTLLAAGDLDHHMGRHDEQYRYYQECLAVARETGDRRTLARTLNRLGQASGMQGGLAMQRRYAEEALTLSRELGDNYLLHASLNGLGTVLVAAGEVDLVEPLYTEALMLCRESGDRESTAISLLNLVTLSLQRGAPQGIRKWMLEALAIAQQTSSKKSELIVLVTVAQLAAYLCDWPRAARFYGACLAHAEETGLQIELEGPAQARPERAREALGSAAFTAAVEVGRLLGNKNAVAEARAWLEVARAPEIS